MDIVKSTKVDGSPPWDENFYRVHNMDRYHVHKVDGSSLDGKNFYKSTTWTDFKSTRWTDHHNVDR